MRRRRRPAAKALCFDGFSTYPRIGSWTAARDLPDATHTVTVKLTDERIDKAGTHARRNGKIDDPKRYDLHHWHVRWNMVVGELECDQRAAGRNVASHAASSGGSGGSHGSA